MFVANNKTMKGKTTIITKVLTLKWQNDFQHFELVGMLFLLNAFIFCNFTLYSALSSSTFIRVSQSLTTSVPLSIYC